jgi:hypothetical protein
MAKVKVAVRLRGETREDAVELALGKVPFDDLFEEIQLAGLFGGLCGSVDVSHMVLIL